MPSLFISYRRSDRPDTVKLIYQRLKKRLPHWEIFCAIGWHILLMKPEEFRTCAPVSPMAGFVLTHLSEDLFAV
jgi:hypothetical protein